MSESSLTVLCPRCKTERHAKNVQNVVLPNGRPALEGDCPVCGTKLLQIVYPNACQ